MGNQFSHVKEYFHQLDTDQKGYLVLSDLVHPTVNIPNVCSSPIMMFIFDDAKDGKLTYDDFLNLINCVEEIQKRIEKEENEKMMEQDNQIILDKIRITPETTETHSLSASANNTPPLAESSTQIPTTFSPIFSPVVSRSVSPCVSFSPNSQLRAIPPNSPNQSLSQSSQKPQTKSSNQHMSLLWSLFDKEMKNKFEQIIYDKGKNDGFTMYLFNLTDSKKRQKIYREDIENLLSVLADDGITIENLLLELPETKPKNFKEEANVVFETYQFRKKRDYLDWPEFGVLARIITKNYVLKSEGNKIRLVGDYELQRVLGKGSEGYVRVAVHRQTGERKAIKIFEKTKQINLEHLENEIASLRKLNHPNIVKLEEVIENESQLYFVMELCSGGSLAEHVAIAPFSIPVTRGFFKQILSGLKYCHDCGIVHRDLKLENILLDNDGINLKICDFGHSTVIITDWDYVQSAIVGSLYQIAPEQLQDHCYRGKKADVWSVGVMLVRMLTGQYPFYSKDPEETVNLIKNAVYQLPETIPPDIQELISNILVINPQQRYSLEQVIESSFVKSDVVLPLTFIKRRITIDSVMISLNDATKLMMEILNKNNILVKKKTISLDILYCYEIKTQTRFNVSCRSGNSVGSNAYFEFIMTDGGGIDFRNLIDLIKKQYLERVDKCKFIFVEKSLDSLLVDGSRSILSNLRRTYEESVIKSRIGVLLCGKSGCGKTSIAQRFFSSKLEIQDFEPTKYYQKYTHPNKPILLFDAKGIELTSENMFWDETRSFLNAHKGVERIHCVWYVVDATMSRFDVEDEKICRSLFDVPLIIIINKADLVSDEQLMKLKTKIEEFKFEKCVGVVTCVSNGTNEAKKLNIQHCRKCHSDDICIFIKQCVIICNSCGYEQTIASRTYVDEYDKIIELTIKLLPEAMKTAFVSVQSLSLRHKTELSKKLILTYNQELTTNAELERKRVMNLLTKLNKIWDLEDLHSVQIASKVIVDFMMNGDVEKCVENFFSETPVFDANEFTAMCIVWVECLIDLHLLLTTQTVTEVNKTSTLEQIMEQAFVKLRDDYVDRVENDLIKNGLESVLSRIN